jgi:hypothetical protein
MSRNIKTTSDAQGVKSLEAYQHPVTGYTHTHEAVPLGAYPPISMDCFVQQSGLSPVTLWRFRKRGWINTCVIAGRHYITREEIARFNTRLEAGEFAGNGPQTPARS